MVCIKHFLSLTLILSSFSIKAQIGREFKDLKVYGAFTQCIEKNYENINLDSNGVPIIPKKNESESVYKLKNGYNIETHHFEIEEGKKKQSVSIIFERDKAIIKGAEILTYFKGKESPLRQHTTRIEHGQIVSEKIMKGNKAIGSCTYKYGKTNNSISFKSLEAININKIKSTYYTESDDKGIVFSSHLIKGDTIATIKRIEALGDSISKSLIINHHRNNESRDSILIYERTWYDALDNIKMSYKEMTAITEPPVGQPKSVNFLSIYSYQNIPKKDNAKTAKIEMEQLYGAWRNETDNIELFFEPLSNGRQSFFGSTYLKKSNEPTPEDYLANNTIWIYILKQEFRRGSWLIDANNVMTITLHNGSVLEFLVEQKKNTLTLLPQMINQEGKLKLYKAR